MSGQVNEAVRAEIERRRRNRLLLELLDLTDAWLSRETGILVRDTDRHLARLVGGVLAAARAGSEHLAHAHVVAAAVETGGGLVLTGDQEDLKRLAAPYPHILVAPLP